jgi:hypothetical protein
MGRARPPPDARAQRTSQDHIHAHARKNDRSGPWVSLSQGHIATRRDAATVRAVSPVSLVRLVLVSCVLLSYVRTDALTAGAALLQLSRVDHGVEATLAPSPAARLPRVTSANTRLVKKNAMWINIVAPGRQTCQRRRGNHDAAGYAAGWPRRERCRASVAASLISGRPGRGGSPRSRDFGWRGLARRHS